MHLFTQHFTDIRNVDENEKNLGFGLRYQFSENWAALGGVYNNSLTSHEFKCADSVCLWEEKNLSSRYFSFERLITKSNGYEFGFGFGVADGYKEFIDRNGLILSKSNNYQPMAGPYINIGDELSVKIRYMFSVASLGLQYDF